MSVAIDTAVDLLDTIDLDQVKIDPSLSRLLPASGARRFRSLPLCRVHGELVVATSNEDIDATRRFVASHLDGPFHLVRADEQSLRKRLSSIYAPHPTRVNFDTDSRSEAGEVSEIVEACNDLFWRPCCVVHSDIHLLPAETALHSRFRVDGVLEDYRSFSNELRSGMVSRIKVLAGLNIAEKREPQDGRIRWQADGNTGRNGRTNRIDIRVATIPTRYGERVTMRLLTPIDGLNSLADLGMDELQLKAFSEAIRSSSGLILLTGPTGSGKSTTLYAAIMQLLSARGGNVITVEDPIEYEISGATQVEVDSANKVSFSGALRSVLRHDPDVIMLGEIRDAETAELAIKASLTGHLVFSTLHTNTAAGVVTRLVDMGVAPYLVAATLKLAVAQRLVRRLCPKCLRPSPLDATDAAGLGRIELDREIAYQPNGCVYCAGKGFVGRTALFEIMQGGSEVAKMIAGGATELDLSDFAKRSGCRTLIDDGIDKVLLGTTTVEQVLGTVATW